MADWIGLVNATPYEIGSGAHHTELGYKVGPRLRELATRGQRESGGGIHTT